MEFVAREVMRRKAVPVEAGARMLGRWPALRPSWDSGW